MTDGPNGSRAMPTFNINISNSFDPLNVEDCENRIDNIDRIHNNSSITNGFVLKSKNTNVGIRRPRKPITFNVFSDSHGRSIASSLSDINLNFKTCGVVKPKAKFNSVVEPLSYNTDNKCENSGYSVVIGGANNIYYNEAKIFLKDLVRFLQFFYTVNLIITTCPVRYDLPMWSCVNKEIAKTNDRLKHFSSKFTNVKLIDLSVYSRDLFSKKGIHLNCRGERKLAMDICKLVSYNLNLSKCNVKDNLRRLELTLFSREQAKTCSDNGNIGPYIRFS